jgi:O-acetyl-ADP-ribose deacetylase
MRGGGVCGAIHKEAGIDLEKECMELKRKRGIDWLPIGEAVATKAYDLPAKHVIHTVGPKNNGKDDVSLLKDCYVNSIELADSLGAESISFPAIATNIYGVPIEISAKIVKEALKDLPDPKNLKKVILVFNKEGDLECYNVWFG